MAAVKSRTITVAHVLNGTDTFRKTVRTLTWSSHTPMHGLANVKSVVANDENGFKVLTFQAYKKVVKLTDSQQGKVKRNSRSRKK